MWGCFLQPCDYFRYILFVFTFLLLRRVQAQPTGTAPLGSSHSINTQEAQIIRTNALRERLKLPSNSSRGNAPGTQLTTSTLLQHEHGGGLPGDAKTMVCWQVHHFDFSTLLCTSHNSQVRRAKAKSTYIDANLGSSSKKWSNSLFLNGEFNLPVRLPLNVVHLYSFMDRYQGGHSSDNKHRVDQENPNSSRRVSQIDIYIHITNIFLF